jgi:phosphoheptose isomerase
MADSSSAIVRTALADAAKTLQSVGLLEEEIRKAAEVITECLRAGNKLLACGNGGSAADAADFCTEFACRFTQDRRPYPAINLAQGGSLVTATGNDYGFEEIFARQIAAFAKPGDALVVITTSGKSANIRRALEQGQWRIMQKYRRRRFDCAGRFDCPYSRRSQVYFARSVRNCGAESG